MTIKMWNHQTKQTRTIGTRPAKTGKQIEAIRVELIERNRKAKGCWLYFAE